MHTTCFSDPGGWVTLQRPHAPGTDPQTATAWTETPLHRDPLDRDPLWTETETPLDRHPRRNNAPDSQTGSDITQDPHGQSDRHM